MTIARHKITHVNGSKSAPKMAILLQPQCFQSQSDKNTLENRKIQLKAMSGQLLFQKIRYDHSFGETLVGMQSHYIKCVTQT